MMRYPVKYLLLLLLLAYCNGNRPNKTVSKISTSLDSLKRDSSDLNKNNISDRQSDTLYCDCKNGKLLFAIQSDTSIVIIKKTNQH